MLVCVCTYVYMYVLKCPLVIRKKHQIPWSCIYLNPVTWVQGPDSGPLLEQRVHLIAEPSLQPHFFDAHDTAPHPK